MEPNGPTLAVAVAFAPVEVLAAFATSVLAAAANGITVQLRDNPCQRDLELVAKDLQGCTGSRSVRLPDDMFQGGAAK